MRNALICILTLMGAIWAYGPSPITKLTLFFAEKAGHKQQHMLSLGKLNRALLRNSGGERSDH